MRTQLDLIAIGRVSVDLYGQQIGARLEDVSTFAKAVGGSPANVAIGAARLGLRSALISRVGDEPMGRFVKEQLAREGVDARGVRVDGRRLTSLVLLSVRDEQTFPLVFYRENCADSALCEDDIDEEFVASSRALLVTGTHFSLPEAAKAQRRAIGIARAHGRKVLLDIDYRPNLWGIGGHGAGETRYARSARVTNTLAAVLPDCDLIVGTEEEMHIAAGREDTLQAIRHIRAVSNATIVCKRGPAGCIVFAGGIPERLEEGLVARGMNVEVYNVLGAGDAFLAGFLHGYLHEAPHELSARFANACGALAVSRLLCSSEFPTLAELEHYLAHGSTHRALREDSRLNHLHWATTRSKGPTTLLALAIDDRLYLERLASELNAARERLARLESLAVEAVARVADGRAGFGVLLGGSSGAGAAREAMRNKLWVARAVEQPASNPLEFEGVDSLAVHLLEWPTELTAKCLCLYPPDDSPAVRRAQERNLLRLAAVCRAQGRELLLGISLGNSRELHEDALARIMTRIYELDIRPDWWGLEPQPSTEAWERCAGVVSECDSHCRGILVLGLAAPLEELTGSAAIAAASPLMRGVLPGRTIFANAARAWLAGEMSDRAAIDDIAAHFRKLLATDVETLMAAFARNTYNEIGARLQSPSDFDALRDALKANPSLHLEVRREREVVQEQFKPLNNLLNFVSYFIGTIMAVGATLGAVNSLYAVVDSRRRELATLRAFGFGSSVIAISTLCESVLYALPGALLGGAIAWVFFNGMSTSPFGYSFQLAVTPSLAEIGIAWALAMGLIGGLLPALRAGRVSVTTALRAV